MNRSAQLRPILAVMMAVTLMAGVAEAQTKINPGWNMFSPQQDVEIGAQSAAEAERQLPPRIWSTTCEPCAVSQPPPCAASAQQAGSSASAPASTGT